MDKTNILKKIGASALAAMTVITMSISAMPVNAASAVPSKTDSAEVGILGIREDDAIVHAYQIVHAEYDRDGDSTNRGFIGYQMTGDLKTNTGDTIHETVQGGTDIDSDAPANPADADVNNFYAPTKKEIGILARKLAPSGSYVSRVVPSSSYNYDNDRLKKIPQYTLTTDGVEDENHNYTYKATLPVGEYLVLVKGTNANIYNPMIISVSYSKAQSGTSNVAAQNGALNGRGDNNSNQDATDDGDQTDHFFDSSINELDGSQTWSIEPTFARSKWSTVDIEKTIVTDENVKTPKGDDSRIGDEIKFKVVADIPNYDAPQDADGVWSALQYKISDTMSEGFEPLGYKDGADSGQIPKNHNKIKVQYKDGDTLVDVPNDGTYELTAATGSRNFVVDFGTAKGRQFILAHPGQEITVTYSGYLAEGAMKAFGLAGHVINTNDVELVYSHNPEANTDVEYIVDEVGEYTFDVTMTKIALKTSGKKRDPEQNEQRVVLPGAEFTLYADAECRQPLDATPGNVTDNTSGTAPNKYTVATAGEDGKFTFKGLDSKTYYMKETKAPNGYALNDHIFKIVITANFDAVSQVDTIVSPRNQGAGATHNPYNDDETNTSVVGAEYTYGTTANDIGLSGPILYAGKNSSQSGWQGPALRNGAPAQWNRFHHNTGEFLKSYTVKIEDCGAPAILSGANANGTLVKETTFTNNGTFSQPNIVSSDADTPVVINETTGAIESSITDIQDVKLSNLPSTGGMGTLLFAALGALFVVMAAMYLRRGNEAEDGADE